jgi:endonuclease/exonuclease/phosphatase family metal-dependent hydrolase
VKDKLLLVIFLSISTNVLAKIVPESITVMSLNIYGWKTMPEHKNDYARLIKKYDVDILGIQEGVDDWQLDTKLPTNYLRSKTLKKSLGKCWHHKFQIFINHCQGNRFIDSGRFDLSDGPNATRTGEYAVIEKLNRRYLIVNVHWDHESTTTRIANAKETSAQLKLMDQYPQILLGDFNSQCDGREVSLVQSKTKMTLLNNAGIDCLFVKGLAGKTKKIVADPSDHPGIVATLIKDDILVR